MAIDLDMGVGKWNPKNLELYSWTIAKVLRLDIEALKKCYDSSFKPFETDGRYSFLQLLYVYSYYMYD